MGGGTRQQMGMGAGLVTQMFNGNTQGQAQADDGMLGGIGAAFNGMHLKSGRKSMGLLGDGFGAVDEFGNPVEGGGGPGHMHEHEHESADGYNVDGYVDST